MMLKKTAPISRWVKKRRMEGPLTDPTAADEKQMDAIPEFLRSVFYPQALESFRETFADGEIKIILHRGPAVQEELVLENLFPFMTIQDLKVALYIALGKEDYALPEFVYLATHGSEPGKTYLGGKTLPLDYSWSISEKGGLSMAATFLAQPFKLASGALPLDTRFVDANGDRKLGAAAIYRERVTIEDMFLKKAAGTAGTAGAAGTAGTAKVPEIHAYFYRDLEATIPGERPLSELEWNGRLYPYFPFISTTTAEPTERQRGRAKRLATIFTRRQQFIGRLEDILQLGTPLIPLTLAGVRLLRLTWGRRKEIPGIESLFYEAPVGPTRPFMRLLPSEGTSISKVYMNKEKKPDLQDPTVLLNWAEELSPTPEKDYAFAKILVRKGYVNLAPLYSTLRLFDDGSADVIVEPPKGMKKLEPRTDLESYGEALRDGLVGFQHLRGSIPDIGNGALVLGVRLKKESDVILGPRILRERLPIFSAFFQEIQPLPGEKPLAMLRYKLISNFVSEDRVNQFITQVISRKVVKGEVDISNLKEIVADEFQMDIEEARDRVAEKLRTMGEVALVDFDTKDYMLQYNPGIDIAIYAQHPFYTFHLYRVNSVENFRRIVTALSLLISVPSDDLEIGQGAVRELQRAETVEASVSATAMGFETKVQEEEAVAAGSAEVPALPAVPAEEAEDVGGADDMPEYMDFFMGDEGEAAGMTLEEEATAAAAAVEAPSPAAVPAPLQTLRKEIAADTEAPKESLQDMKEMAATAAGRPAAAAAAAPQATNNDNALAGTPATGIANFFLRKLQEADRRLFNYTKTHPSLKPYVSGCQPTYGRQPAVVNQEKFEEMREEYAKDGVVFQVFPLEPGEVEEMDGVLEKDYFTVLRYGTSAQNQNFYICSRYFCTRDEMIIREVDLKSDRMRRPIQRKDGTLDYSKEPGECPFCKGTVIKNKKYPGPNETILERPEIPKTNKQRMLYIRFLKKTPHPEGFYLPCCFQDPLPIKFQDNPAFDKYKEWGVPPKPAAFKRVKGDEGADGAIAAAAAGDTSDSEEEEEGGTGTAGAAATGGPTTETGYPIVDYWVMLASVNKRYIVGAEKFPLEIGSSASQFQGEPQIGLLPLALNPYFDQDPTGLVSRSFNPQKLKPGAKGFLRVAVENRLRYQNDSLLSALAPYYYLNTAEQMKRHIYTIVRPRVFLGLNYGNLALEFYDPATPVANRPSDGDLSDWASDELQVDLQQENKEALMRAYLSYKAFEAWLFSSENKKEFRQLALLLAQSKLLRREERRTAPGITFIVLDVDKGGKVSVRCPPYGFNAEIQSQNDVAFLMHHWSGVWEPIFYVDNREEGQRNVQMSTLVFKRSEFASWPEIVTRRFQEYITQCSSSGRTIYTSQSRINSMAMIPASLAKRVFQKESRLMLSGVIRDAYNHLVALLLRERGGQGEPMGPIVPFPVIDDGDLIIHLNLYLDWDDPALERELAPADVATRFYRKYVEPHFKIYPGYKVNRIVTSKATGQVQALQLRNGLFIPARPIASEADAEVLLRHKMEVDEMEWTLNHEIVLGERKIEIPGEAQRLERKELDEVFEHLRLTFSNWLASKERGGQFRTVLEEVIFSRRLPLFEKRKRLEILLSREVEKWITTDFADEDQPVAAADSSLLRVDCSLRTVDTCSSASRCVWKRAGAGAGAGSKADGQCLLHVPQEAPLGEDRLVSAPRLLLLRLIEELLRYSDRRRQLLDRDVTRLAAFEKPITLKAAAGQEGEQVIYPEKSTAWFELLRLEWAKKPDEKPRFIEEMSREVRVQGPAPEETDTTRLPPSLETFLGAPQDPKVGALRLLRAPFPDLFTPLGILPSQIGVTEETKELSAEMVDKIVEATARTVIQIDIRTDEAMKSPLRRKPWGTRSFFPTVPVFIVTAEGPALLVENPENPSFLKVEAMPASLKKLVDTAKGKVMIKKPGVAAGPAGPAAVPT